MGGYRRNSRKMAVLSAKRKAVQQGVFRAELNEFLSHVLAEDGYAGVDVRYSKVRTEIVISCTNNRHIMLDEGQRIRELTSMIQKRFGFQKGTVDIYIGKVHNKGLCAMSMVESLRHKLLKAVAVRRAAYGVVRTIMDSGAIGCEVIISGKVRAQRAKAMKFQDGYLFTTGHPSKTYVESAVRSVEMKQGVLGLKVRIMKPHDPDGKNGPSERVPDNVEVLEPKQYAKQIENNDTVVPVE